MTTNNPHFERHLASHMNSPEARNAMLHQALMDAALKKYQAMAVYGNDEIVENVRLEYLACVEAYLDAYLLSARKLLQSMTEGKI